MSEVLNLKFNGQAGVDTAMEVSGSDYVTITNDLVVTNDITVGGDIAWTNAFAHTGSSVGFFGVTPTTRKTGYATSNPTWSRNLDGVTDVDGLKGVVKAIIDDLTALGLFNNA